MSRLAALRKNGPRGIGYKLFVNPSYHTMGRRRVGVAITALALLALFAAEAGAKHVYAIEAQPEAAEAARQVCPRPLGACRTARQWL